MISRLFSPFMARLSRLIAVALLLAACSPSYNWREMDVADGHVRAAFPAKVQTQARDISLGGHRLRFTLDMAEVDGSMFAVGHARLPEAVAGDPAARLALRDALVQSLYANLGARPATPLPGDGEVIEIHGQAGERPGWILARVWVTDTLLVDAVAAGSPQGLPRERAQEFVQAVKINR